MARERELKLPLDDRAALRRRLQREGAILEHGESFEDNEVWDRGGELRRAGCLLRLRTDGRGSRLTYKGPASFEDGVKVRAEHETAVAEPAALAEVLSALGYERARRYQKYREEWCIEGVVVALDRTPMGDFVEFEGAGVREVARRCGCDPGAALAGDYLALYDGYRREHSEAPAEMVFPEERRRGG